MPASFDTIRARRPTTALQTASAGPAIPPPKRTTQLGGGFLVVLVALGFFLLATRPSADTPTETVDTTSTSPATTVAPTPERIGPPQPDAGTALEETVILDKPLPNSREQNQSTPASTNEEETKATAGTTVDTSFTVRILNGSAATGLAGTYQERLSTGFTVLSIGTAVNTYETSVVYYQPGKRGSADTLVRSLGEPTPTLQENTIAKPADVLLVLGKDRSK